MSKTATTSQTVQGLIIKEQKVSENDRLVTILTDEVGVVKAFCSGSLKITAKNLSSTAFLSYSRLTLIKSRDTYKITETKSLKIFWELRNDLKLLSLASYFCEAVSFHAPKEENAADILRLTLNCLHLLSCGADTDKIKAVFELKLAAAVGYMPNLTGCAGCGKPLGDCLFDTVGGVICCEKCAAERHLKFAEYMPAGVLAAMRHIVSSPLERAFSFSLGSDSTRRLMILSEMFFVSVSGKNFDTLNFYKTYSNEL